MDVHTNIPLKNYTTMQLGGNARFMTNVSTKEQVAELCRNARSNNLQIAILGEGSNTIAHDEGFDGLVLRNTIKGTEIVDDNELSVLIRFGAGEHWDDCVQYCVERNLSGIEALSAIPGTIGAAPVQNIGAYGQELSDTFEQLEAYDIDENSFVTMSPEDCEFSYRHSIFRGEQAGRYVITSVTLRLYKSQPSPPFYQALQEYFDQHNITLFTVQTVRDAVTTIRADKLPDPSLKPNAGSFFKNAIVEDWLVRELLHGYPSMPHFDLGDKTYKVPTGWLIEQSGLKGKLINGMRVHDKNCLVLINESAQSYDDLDAARRHIITAVRDQFRITIEQEPLEL